MRRRESPIDAKALSSPRLRKIAWGLWSTTLLFVAADLVLTVITRRTETSPAFGFRGIDDLLPVVFATVGIIIATRQSRNLIGWTFLVGFGALGALQGVGHSWGIFGIYGRTVPLPGAVVGAWLNAWLYLPQLGSLVTVVFLIFPHGTLLSKRWRPVAWVAVVAIVVASAGTALIPGPLEGFSQVQNPFGIDKAIAGPAQGIGTLLLVAAILVAVASLFVRYHRALTDEREQLKWIAYAGALAAIAVPVGSALSTRVKAADALVLVSILAIPVAVGVAILRYGLYDIDRIISRTLSYALVTAILGGTFTLIVLVPTAVIGSNTKTPQWLVAAATLVGATLFRPVKRRVQDAVDRRFNRHRYDAARTIEAFSSRLRDEIDMDTLGAELRDIVFRTMQPAHLALWLRQS